MAIDITSPRSRRSLITAVLGGVAAAAAATLAGAQQVLAAGDDGQVIHVGDQYADVRTTTFLTIKTNDFPVLGAESTGSGSAFSGRSDSGSAVEGASGSGFGVHGLSDSFAGIQGYSGQGTGVQGLIGDAHSSAGFPAALLGEAKAPSGAGSLGNNLA